MSKLPDDDIIAYDCVKDTLGAAISECVSVLNEERAKETPDQDIIDKYEEKLKEIFSIEREISISDSKRMQEIYDEYNQFVRSHRGLT